MEFGAGLNTAASEGIAQPSQDRNADGAQPGQGEADQDNGRKSAEQNNGRGSQSKDNETESEQQRAQRYDKENALRLAGDADRQELRQRWPMSQGKDNADMSGMDCVAVVLRYIWSLIPVGGNAWMHFTGNAQQASEFVNLAVDVTFNGRTLKAEQETRDRMVEWASETLGGAGNPSFYELMESEHMRVWLWSCSDLLLTQPWRRLLDNGTSKTREADLLALRVQHGLVLWETPKHSSVKEAIEWTLGPWRAPGEELRMDLECAFPYIIRVKLGLTEQKLQRLSFRDMMRFSLPGQKDDTGKELVHQYTIAATVRLRSPGDKGEKDYVRIYEANCNNYIPPGTRHVNAAFVNDDWSVADQDHEYMLYYARTDTAPLLGRSGVEVVRSTSP